MFVDHTCKGGHPNHNHNCGTKKLGVIGCSQHRVNTPMNFPPPSHEHHSQDPKSNQTGFVQKLDDGVKIPHLPSFLCNCNWCADFFDDFQYELDDYEIENNIGREWTNFHLPSSSNRSKDNENDYETDSEEDDDICVACGEDESLGWTNLCFDCDCEDYNRRCEEYENSVLNRQ